MPRRRCIRVAALSICGVLALGTARLHSQPYDEQVWREAKFLLEIYGHPPDTVVVGGPAELHWGERYFNGVTDVIDMELLASRMHGEHPVFGCVSVIQHLSPPTLGRVEFAGPGADFPAESFFDVTFEIILPNIMPGDTVWLTSPFEERGPIDMLPPWHRRHKKQHPDTCDLFNRQAIPVGEIRFWEEEINIFSPPRASLSAPTSHGTDMAEAINDTLVFRASVAGWVEPDWMMPKCFSVIPMSATFGIREEGDPGPFVPFYTDLDGAGCEIGTTGEMREGDGWAGYLDIMPFPPEGRRYEIEVMFDFGYRDLRDTTRLRIDPRPPKPRAPDSLSFVIDDEPLLFEFTVPAEIVPQVELRVQRLATDYQRTLEVVNQESLTEDERIGSVACGPAAAAGCLKYWAKNGHPKLEHPGGDQTKPAQSATEMGKELLNDIDPRPDKDGAQAEAIKKGIEKYLDRHQCAGWSVSQEEITDMAGLGKMMREFEADKEDVIMIVSDTTREGGQLKRTGHAVTLGSRHSEAYTEKIEGKDVHKVRQKVDFTDSRDSTGCNTNEYEVGTDAQGNPTTIGYTHTNGFSSARISGYIKVSPPAAGSPSIRRPGVGAPAAPQEGDWIVVDSAPGIGGGMPNVLVWNTAGFPGGLYLVEIRATDDLGNTGTSLSLAAIPEYTVDAQPGVRTPAATRITGSFPNPFNPATTIEYAVARRGRISISVYDVSGRLVRNLVDRELREPGSYRIRWDGTTEAGRSAESGLYFCVIRSDDAVQAGKMILLR
ncbi:MAG: hypothetical protein PHQ19_02005 [Candidatus Krumholzibacteria bacterium]|nr:hypothetical protein [Candidatus Krumholzibacteria bacterium]